MIPTNVASRLQTLIDRIIDPVAAVGRIRANLPELGENKNFQAEIKSILPDGKYRAEVNGKTLTLALPQDAKIGDTLELVTTAQKDGVVYAKLSQAPPQANASNSSSATQNAKLNPNNVNISQPIPEGAEPTRPTLSTTAQVISQVLQEHTENKASGLPTQLGSAKPILTIPPTSAAARQSLAQGLQQAIQESGLFYESHQAKWVNGTVSLESLLREPQGQHSPLLQNPTNAIFPGRELGNATPESIHNTPTATSSLANEEVIPEEQILSKDTIKTAHNRDLGHLNNSDEAEKTISRMPTGVSNIVGQQLDSLANQHINWTGQIWPGQIMQWHVAEHEPPPKEGDGSGTSEEQQHEWHSSMRLQLPALGDLEAKLILTAEGVALRISAQNETSVTQLQEGQDLLDDGLAAAGIKLLGISIETQHD